LKLGEAATAMLALGQFFSPLMHAVIYEPENITKIERAMWEGKPCLAVEFRTPTRETEARALVDPVALTPIKRTESFGDGATREVFFYDYELMGPGILEPRKIESYRAAKLVNRITIESFEVNAGVISSIFEYTGDETGTAESEAATTVPGS
jgi:hypothetical protein